MGNYGTNNAMLHSKGFSLVATLLLLLLLSGLAIGLMMMVNTETKVGSTDLQNDLAYHAAEGGVEKIYSDLSTVIAAVQAPTIAQLCAVNNTPPSMTGVTFPFYKLEATGMNVRIVADIGELRQQFVAASEHVSVVPWKE